MRRGPIPRLLLSYVTAMKGESRHREQKHTSDGRVFRSSAGNSVPESYHLLLSNTGINEELLSLEV